MSLTDLEKAVLNELLHDEYNALNGGKITEDTTLEDLSTWGGSAPDVSGYSKSSVKGAMGSLAKKDYIVVQGSENDLLMDFTQKALEYGKVLDCKEA